jgi:hypothetical protein
VWKLCQGEWLPCQSPHSVEFESHGS